MTFLIPYKAKIAPIEPQQGLQGMQGLMQGLGQLGGIQSGGLLPWAQQPKPAWAAEPAQNITYDFVQNASYQGQLTAAQAVADQITSKLTESEKTFLLNAIKGKK